MLQLTEQGYGGLTSFVVIVPDTRAEAGFFRAVFGLEELMHHRLSGAGHRSRQSARRQAPCWTCVCSARNRNFSAASS